MATIGGHGISGHLNGFASKVLVGNWVEDVVGAELAANCSRVSAENLTESRHEFSCPRSKAEGPNGALPSEKVTMRGLEATLLLSHCEKGNVHIPQPSDARFSTTNGESFASGPQRLSQSLARKRRLAADREKLATGFETTSKTAQQSPFLPQAAAAVGKNTGKRIVSSIGFSKEFLQAQKFEMIRKSF